MKAKFLLTILFLGLSSVSFVSCDSDTEDKMEDVGDKIEESVDNTGDAIDDAAEDAEDKMEEVTD